MSLSNNALTFIIVFVILFIILLIECCASNLKSNEKQMNIDDKQKYAEYVYMSYTDNFDYYNNDEKYL